MHHNQLTATPGGAASSEWEILLRAQNEREAALEKAREQGKQEAEIAIRNYVQSPKQSPHKNYDDRLHVRLNCGKTKAYELLKLYEEGKEGGLRHKRIGAKYIVSEQAVREWEGNVHMQVSTSKAA